MMSGHTEVYGVMKTEDPDWNLQIVMSSLG